MFSNPQDVCLASVVVVPVVTTPIVAWRNDWPQCLIGANCSA